MDNGGGVWSFMPGDEMELEVQVHTYSRVSHVLAVFSRQEGRGGPRSGHRLVFGGEYGSRVYAFERTGEGRLTRAILSLLDEHSTRLTAGDYPLTDLEAVTFGGKRLQSDSLPNLTIVVEQEPAEEQTTRITDLYFADER